MILQLYHLTGVNDKNSIYQHVLVYFFIRSILVLCHIEYYQINIMIEIFVVLMLISGIGAYIAYISLDKQVNRFVALGNE
jgi:hypothetical protein